MPNQIVETKMRRTRACARWGAERETPANRAKAQRDADMFWATLQRRARAPPRRASVLADLAHLISTAVPKGVPKAPDSFGLPMADVRTVDEPVTAPGEKPSPASPPPPPASPSQDPGVTHTAVSDATPTGSPEATTTPHTADVPADRIVATATPASTTAATAAPATTTAATTTATTAAPASTNPATTTAATAAPASTTAASTTAAIATSATTTVLPRPAHPGRRTVWMRKGVPESVHTPPPPKPAASDDYVYVELWLPETEPYFKPRFKTVQAREVAVAESRRQRAMDQRVRQRRQLLAAAEATAKEARHGQQEAAAAARQVQMEQLQAEADVEQLRQQLAAAEARATTAEQRRQEADRLAMERRRAAEAAEEAAMQLQEELAAAVATREQARVAEVVASVVLAAATSSPPTADVAVADSAVADLAPIAVGLPVADIAVGQASEQPLVSVVEPTEAAPTASTIVIGTDADDRSTDSAAMAPRDDVASSPKPVANTDIAEEGVTAISSAGEQPAKVALGCCLIVVNKPDESVEEADSPLPAAVGIVDTTMAGTQKETRRASDPALPTTPSAQEVEDLRAKVLALEAHSAEQAAKIGEQAAQLVALEAKLDALMELIIKMSPIKNTTVLGA